MGTKLVTDELGALCPKECLRRVLAQPGMERPRALLSEWIQLETLCIRLAARMLDVIPGNQPGQCLLREILIAAERAWRHSKFPHDERRYGEFLLAVVAETPRIFDVCIELTTAKGKVVYWDPLEESLGDWARRFSARAVRVQKRSRPVDPPLLLPESELQKILAGLFLTTPEVTVLQRVLKWSGQWQSDRAQTAM